MRRKDYHGLIARALAEDLGSRGDITSAAIFPKREKAVFVLLSKDEGLLCGLDPFTHVFELLDRRARSSAYFEDGDAIERGDLVARVYAELRAALAGERTALNMLSHLSGVATKARVFAVAARERLSIFDTRKTVPGLRALQKYAVACGGGCNHRMGLHDMVLIKDNHVDAAGGVAPAVAMARLEMGTALRGRGRGEEPGRGRGCPGRRRRSDHARQYGRRDDEAGGRAGRRRGPRPRLRGTSAWKG